MASLFVVAVYVQAGSVLPPLAPDVVVPKAVPARVHEAPLPAEKTPGKTPVDLIQAVQPEATQVTAKPVKILRAEDILPENLIAFVSIEGPAKLFEEAKNLKIAGLRNEPIVGDAIAKSIDSIGVMFKPGEVDPRSLTGMLGAVGMNPEKILDVFTGQVAFAARENDKGATCFYVVAQLEEGRDTIHDMVEEFGSQVESKHPDIVVSATLFKDMEVRGFEMPDGTVFGYTYIENLLIISSGKGAIEDLIDNYLNVAGKYFVGSRAFQSAYGRLGEGAMVFYILDTPRMLRALANAGKLAPPANAPENVQKLYKDMRAGSLFGIGMIEGAASMTNGGVRDSIQVEAADFPFLVSYMPMAQKGELKLKTAPFVPLDAIFFYAAEDMQKIYREYNTTSSDKTVTEAFKGVEDKTSLDIQNVLQLFKGEFGLTLTVSPGRPYPDLIVISELSDTVAAGNLLDAVKTKLGSDVAEIPMGNKAKMVYYKPGDKSYLSLFNYSPGATIDGNFLVFGTSVDAVRKAVRQHRFAGSSSIQQSTNFKLATGDLPQNINTLFFFDVGRGVDLFYNVGLPLISQMNISAPGSQAMVGDVSIANMPSPESISQHLVPIAMSTRLEDSSLYVDSFSPTGVLSLALLMLGQATDTITTANVAASNAVTADNMRKMGLALHQYAADFDRFPLALSELYPLYVEEQGFSPFMSPSGKKEVNSRDDIDTRSDFVYVPGVRLNDQSDTIIAYTKAYVHDKGMRTVLFLNNKTKSMGETEFKLLMTKQGHPIAEE